MPRKLLTDYLENFRRRGRETAYAHRRGYRWARWSYRKVAETACQFARELEAREIGKGERVLLWGENCAEWVAAFFGCVMRGAVVVPMDRIASAEFALRVARQAEARLLVVSRELSPLAAAFPMLALETLPASVARHSRAPYAVPDLRPDDPVEIVFTSGTTADPKGVMINQRNILANLDPLETEIRKYLKIEWIFHPIRFLNLLPLSHVFGQLLGIFVPQLLGGMVIFQDTLNPREVVRTARCERVSVLVAVPRLLQSLKDKVVRDFEAAGKSDDFWKNFQEAEGEHFVNRWWRFRRVHSQFGWKFWAFVSGGATLDPEIEAFWRRLSFVVVQGYGLTETTSLVSINHPFRLRKGSIGKILPGREFRLDASGEILVRGAGVAAGYWKSRELGPVVGQDGWFHTGDRGELDEQGNLYFKGRTKDVIVTSEGMNIYPEDLEATLRRQPEVRDCAVVGLARNGNAEPCAVLILRGDPSDPEAVVKRANQSLAGYQQIRRWFVWPESDFPRTPTEKPRTHVIQEFVQARMREKAGLQAAMDTELSPIADLIASVTGRPAGRLTAQSNLESDLNLSSLERVELLSAIEDRYQIDLNESHFAALSTVGELERLLRQPPVPSTHFQYPRWTQRWPVTWVRLVVYYLLAWPATLLLGYPRVRGRENLRGVRGPVLVVSNHITSVDIGFVLAALPARLRHRLAVAMLGERLQAMRHPPAGAGLFRRCLDKLSYALVVALFNVFPLPQKAGFRESFSFAGQSADRGYSVLVFPEGRRTTDGRTAPFQAGVGLLASRLDIPVVPVRIDGLFELKQAGKRMTRPGVVKVTIGSPARFELQADPETVARELENRVASL